MKKPFFLLAALLILTSATLFSQGKSPETITASELKSHVTFLASPLLKGRMDGDETLDIAANYLASQAALLGMKPANGDSYFQPFTILRKKADPAATNIKLLSAADTVKLSDPFFHIIPQGPASIDVEGDVVFAGYGIRTVNYNDLENQDIKGKIVIVMNNGPLKDGKPVLNKEFYGDMGFQYKIGALLSPGPKAVLFVPEPSSGHKAFEEFMSGLAGYLSVTTTLKEEKKDVNTIMNMMPKIIFANRSVADALLKGTGKTLEQLQKDIDATLQPQSFLIEGKRLSATERTFQEEKTLNNVAAYIEGSNPVKKNEVVVFSAHYDHIGAMGDQVNAGADDDASGCAALLEMAEAFSGLKKKPLRSVLFLWVAGEEIGLYGSQTYVTHPLFPLKQTVADLNMDMIGRVKEPADSTSETPMTGPDGVFVITGGQSSELINIANDVDKRSRINLDYSLSGRQHPLQLFARSDHYNFVKNDIPVLFFTTGLHSDYHTPRDVVGKLDFEKMELVTRTMYEIGFTVANRKERIIVDNPFSSWGKEK
ncbi:MAG: M28 family peptidase [Chloroflexota bacterium]